MAAPKQICPHCFGKYRSQDYDRHIARHSDSTFMPTIRNPATAAELQAAGLSAPEAAVDSPEQRRAEEAEIMAGPDPVTQDQLRIHDLERENAELKTQAGGHQAFKTNLAHVGGCTNCRHDLDEYNKDIITKAIDSLSVEAIRDLGFEKGAFPQKFELPAV